jgi:DNA repair protein RadC
MSQSPSNKQRQPALEPDTDDQGRSGHRKRLRDRFMARGHEALADYEILELILFRAVPRMDVKPLAKYLLDHFGSISEVISAEPEHLSKIPGIKDAVIAELKIVQAAAQRLLKDKVIGRPVIQSWEALLDYCKSAMAYERREQFRVLYLDRKNCLMEDQVQQTGTVDHTPVYPREVARHALRLGASAVILVHNHPSGDPKPSRGDIDMTKQVIDALRPLQISVHDHLIIAKSGTVSFKSLGLI